jgi:2-octaprenyl-6-methoxyphenol hydroxylase
LVTTATQRTDVLVVGGGLVGNSLALALAGGGHSVQLVEASAPAIGGPPGFDERNLALARASLDALAELGVLDRLQRAPAPIRRIHVSRVGDLGAVRLDAAEHGVEAFGGVVMARDLGAALLSRVAALGLSREAPLSLRAIEEEADGWAVALEGPEGVQRRHCRLLVGADGADSVVRSALGIGARRHDYAQRLFVSTVASASGVVADSAWERFSEHGPVALLPRNDGRFGAVCGVAEAQADAVAALDDRGYRDYLQQRFGWRAGRFAAIGKRVAYAMRQVVADSLVARRGVLIGNAAQSLHPIGAQGFNLGLRDALGLADSLARVNDPGADDVLAAYSRRRDDDRRRTLAFSDGLARLTASRAGLSHALRSLGLLAIDRSRSLQGALVRGAMGYRDALVDGFRGAA